MTPNGWLLFIGIVLVVISLIGIAWIKWTRYATEHPDRPADWWA